MEKLQGQSGGRRSREKARAKKLIVFLWEGMSVAQQAGSGLDSLNNFGGP